MIDFDNFVWLSYDISLMTTKEAAFQRIQSLIARFEEQHGSYRASEYNEILTRRDFIDPFLKALE